MRTQRNLAGPALGPRAPPARAAEPLQENHADFWLAESTWLEGKTVPF